MASIKNQISHVLKTLQAFGESKKSRKEEMGNKGFGNGTDRIHSVKTYQNIRGDAIRYGEWLKAEHGVKNIFKIGDKAILYTKQYIQHLKDRGLAIGTIAGVESSLLHLERGMNKFNREVRGQNTELKIIEGRTLSSSDKEIPQDRAFKSREKAEEVISKMSKSTQSIGHLSLNLGLRLKESLNIRVEHVLDRGDSMKILIPKGEGRGITKGGRFRVVTVPKHFENQLRGMIQGKGLKEKIAGNINRETAKKSIQRACIKAGEHLDKGSHRFRHTYARERLNEHLKSISRGHEILNRIIENKELGFRMDKGIGTDDRGVYEQVKGAINEVHKDLGHGANRWELVLTYMK